MAANGHGVQVVKVTENHTYELDEHELENILMNEEVKDLPVVVVSVAGAYRGGKSFLLNFFIRYLTSPLSARQDGSWLGEDREPLLGFKWRSGIKRTTMGIILWSDPIITTLPSGDKVAILLVDTQGTFDRKSTVRDCSTIFALSTLVSSVLIYNLSQNIQEDDLQHLQLFTEYGKMVKDQGLKAFQVLEFLVRDWQFPADYPYGAVGGEQLLQETLLIEPNLPKEMQELRQDIRSSFEKVSCFLMPHPGFQVLSPDFDGKISEIDIKFRMQLIDLVSSLFSTEKLMPKTINGEQIKARDLFNYFKAYMTLFNSDKIPNPTSIMEATVEAGLLSALNEARDVYEKGMDSECGHKQPSVPAADLGNLHSKYLATARAAFTNKKKMGSKKEADKYLETLTTELEKRLPQFAQMNIAKIQTAINNAKESYEEAIQNISTSQPLCVHPLDLEKVHKAGLSAAIATFDAARKNISKQKDEERDKFIQNIEKRYDLLRLSNEHNNKMMVSVLRMEYWQHMQAKTGLETPLSAGEFTTEHENALKKALTDFDSKRNLPDHYTEDVFKYNLTTAINDSFIQLKAINKSKNTRAMKAAIDEYDNHMKAVWNNTSQCLHPSDLEREHQSGLCRALVKLRPTKQCYNGFDSNDEDENTLTEILRQRFVDAKTLNDSANETAVQEGYSFYVNTMEDLCRPSIWWLLVVPWVSNLSSRSNFHRETKSKAYEVFYSKRRSIGYHSTDLYKDNLDKMIEAAFNKNYTSSLYLKFEKALGTYVWELVYDAIKIGA